MYKKNVFLLLTIFSASIAFSQGTSLFKYTLLGVPDSLKRDADAVVRLDEAILEVLSPSRYKEKVHQVITILNKKGSHYLNHSFRFDKFKKIEHVEIKVYNEFGLEVKKYTKKDFEVRSAYDGISLVTDDKVMSLQTPAPGFPCTVEIISEVSASSYLELPNWYMNTDNESNELFRYVVKVPTDIDIRYRSRNVNLQPQIQTNGNVKTYTWEAKNIPVKKLESGSYENGHHLPQIEVVPTKFEYDGYRGEFNTWKDFGAWNYALYEQKNDPFSDQRIAEITSLAASQPDVKSKVDALYGYLKKNMRYVSIQLGIGGFKPFSVRFVDEKKYGDCKALSNYMRNMLAVAGIKSYPALINAGFNKTPADPGFPSDPFNHVILCVPNGKDSIWLECTSNNNESGFLGSFTENKNALLLTENGGILVPTPKSNCANNTSNVRTDIFLETDGGATVNTSVYSTGDIFDLYNELRQMNPDRQKEIMIQHLKYKVPDSFEPLAGKDSAGGYVSGFKFMYDKLFDFNAGSKYFFSQRLNKFNDEELAETEMRKTEYLFEFPYIKKDTTIYHLPTGFSVENLPALLELKNNLAEYKSEITYDKAANQVNLYSYLILKTNIVQPANFKDMATFFQSINRHQNQKIILKKD
jgi:hypothetical protein